MDEAIEGAITKQYNQLTRQREISLAFPLQGYEKATEALSYAKKIYKKSFLYDFHKIFTSNVE